jgi:hypothetical protein
MCKKKVVFITYVVISLCITGCKDAVVGIKASDRITIVSEQFIPKGYLTPKIASEMLGVEVPELIASFDQKGVDEKIESEVSSFGQQKVIGEKLIQVIDSPKVFLKLEKPAKNHHYLSEELIGYGESGKWNHIVHRKQGAGLSEEDALLNVTNQKYYNPFDSNSNYTFDGVFYEQDKIIIKEITGHYESKYLYIDPNNGLVINSTPITPYHPWGDFFNKDRSVLYYPRKVQNLARTISTVQIEQYKTNVGIWNTVFEMQAIGRMNYQGHIIEHFLSFNNGRFLVFSIKNVGRGGGGGGFVIIDLKSKSILYREYFENSIEYKFFANDVNKLIFSRHVYPEERKVVVIEIKDEDV